MGARTKRINKFFQDENELVYRRKLSVRSIADELIESALQSADGANGSYNPNDLCNVADLAVESFISTLKKGLCHAKQTTVYKHLGYFNEVGDIRNLSRESADDIVGYWQKGFGSFYHIDNPEDDTDLILEEETYNIARGEAKVTSDGKYVVVDTSWEGWKDENLHKQPSDDAGCYIDIYELKEN